MEFAYTLCGGTPHVKKYIVDSAAAIIAGVPVISDMETADADGAKMCSTTAAVGTLGISLDGATTTAAQVGSSDNAAYVSLIINPDAVLRAKLCQGATEDTALTIITQASADTGGLAPGDGATNPLAEHLVWGYSGANMGIVRRTTAALTTVIAFPFDIAAGDEFLQTNTVPAEATQWPTLTTLLTQVDVSTDVDATQDNFNVVENHLRGIGEQGRTNSYTFLTAASHAFGAVGTLAT
jgi:hypothetical protein